MYLPLANILHYKLRSVLSALGIGIGICMLVTLSGLADGTVGEIGDRWEAVDADLIVCPRGLGDNMITLNGPVLSDRFAEQIAGVSGVARVVPVFLAPVRFAGQDHTVVGVDPRQWHTLSGGRQVDPPGRLFDPDREFARWIDNRVRDASSDTQPVDLDREVAAHGGLELVVDSRLAAVGHYAVGQTVEAAGQTWKIVGVVKAGAMARAFIPLRTAQYIFGLGGLGKSTMMFVKLAPGADHDAVAKAIRRLSPALDAVPLTHYRRMLQEKLAVMYRYIEAVNAIALVIAFLFIMVTLYMMVLQRTREIAILKSCGAGWAFILRQVLGESALLTAAGVAAGIAMSFAGAWCIERFAPLYTVVISWHWVAIACAAAAAGSAAAAIFPAWRAMRVDMVEALTLE